MILVRRLLLDARGVDRREVDIVGVRRLLEPVAPADRAVLVGRVRVLVVPPDAGCTQGEAIDSLLAVAEGVVLAVDVAVVGP